MNDTLHLITIATTLCLLALIVALAIGPALAEALTLPVLR